MLTHERFCTYFRHVILVAFCILVAALSRAGYAQVARMEVIPFESLTLTDQEFLAGREDGKPVTVAGELRLPRAGAERFPLVIMLHGQLFNAKTKQPFSSGDPCVERGTTIVGA